MSQPESSIRFDSQIAAQAAISETCDEIKNMLLQKNEAYGNSAFDPVRLFSKSSAKEQILVRMDDKISRLSRGQAAGEDVYLDLIGYLIIYRAFDRYEELTNPQPRLASVQ